MTKNSNTQEKLLYFGKKEFLAHGFKNASLRNIAKESGVTTGAIYGYYKDKNALFEALVSETCNKTKNMFDMFGNEYYLHADIMSFISIEKTLNDLKKIYEFIFSNIEEFRLLVCCAQGSSKANFVDEMVEYETSHIISYLQALNNKLEINFEINEATIHIISDGYINAMLELVRHNMSYDESLRHIEFLGKFYTGGWLSVIDTCKIIT